MHDGNHLPRTKVARHAAIARILGTEEITTQSELRTRLEQEGIFTAQATVSRDLFEMRATRIRTNEGKSIYAISGSGPNPVLNGPENAGLDRLTKFCQTLLVVAEQSGNFVVLRTPAGAAQLMASALDNAVLPGMMGCVAGNDTVFVLCTGPETALELTRKLVALADQYDSEE